MSSENAQGCRFHNLSSRARSDKSVTHFASLQSVSREDGAMTMHVNANVKYLHFFPFVLFLSEKAVSWQLCCIKC